MAWAPPGVTSRSSQSQSEARYGRRVSRLELRAFAEEQLDAAGALLAARHRAHRAAEPLLSERFEDPDASRAEIASLWAKEHASGAVALRDGRLVGFLIGTRKDDQTWGANVWIEAAGYAAARARGRSRSLCLLVAAVGRRRPNAPLRRGAGARRSDRRVVPAQLRRATGARDRRGARLTGGRRTRGTPIARPRGADRARAARLGPP